MTEISPKELLAQLEEDVALIAADPREQEAWAERRNVPAEEIALQFYDAVPLWFPRLRENGLIDGADERALADLNRYLENVQGNLFFDGPSVRDSAPEWETVRRLAARALASLRRPMSEKSGDS